MLRRWAERTDNARERPRLPRVPDGLDWDGHGLQPRWLGMETSDCAVALKPSIFHGSGADELDRFLDGARRRGELALVVAVIGDADDDRARHPLSRFDSSVHMARHSPVSMAGVFPPVPGPASSRGCPRQTVIWGCGCSTARRMPHGRACS